MIPFHSHTLRHWLTSVHFSLLLSLAALSASAQTPVPGHAFTAPATKVTGTNAFLNGAATANGSATTAWFEWGTSTNYGFQTESLAVGDGNDLVWLNAQIQDLTPGQVYHFRLTVSNEAAVVYGADHVFALGKKVCAWGDLWGPASDYPGLTGVPEGLSNVTALAAGEYHNVALREDGTVFAWGPVGNYWFSRGQTNVPADLTNVIAIAAGTYHSLALKEDGTVTGWGFDSYGQSTPPEGVTNVVAIAAASTYSLALKRDGTMAFWGEEFHYSSPPMREVTAGLSNVVAIAAGLNHCIALQIDGTVTVWGNFNAAQLNATSQLTNIVAISAGPCQAAALRRDGTVLTWGWTQSCGWRFYSVPREVHTVVAVAAGGDDYAAIITGGTVITWAYWNGYPRHYDPINAVALAAADGHYLALGGNQPPRVRWLDQVQVFPRETVQFSAVVEGTGPFGYQWKKGTNTLVDNARISGASTKYLTISGITLSDAGPYTLTVTNLAGTAHAPEGSITVLTPSTRPYHGLFSEPSVCMEHAGALRNFIITPSRAYSGTLLVNGRTYNFAGRFDGHGRATQTLNVAPSAIQLWFKLEQNPGIGSSLWGCADPNGSIVYLHAAPAGNLPPSSHWLRFTSSGAGNSPRGSSMGLVRINGSLGTLTGSLPDGSSFSISVPVVSSPSAKDGDFPVHAQLYNGRGLLTGWAHLGSNQFAGNLTWIKKASNGQYPRGFTNELHIETLTLGIRR